MSRTISISVDEVLLKGLEELARRERRDLSHMAADILRDWMEMRRDRARIMEQALREEEEGNFISSAAIHEWMAFWDSENELPPPVPDIRRD